VTDQLDGTTYTWTATNYVHLDPHTRPAHIFTIERNDEGVRVGGDDRVREPRRLPGVPQESGSR
ncbi:hypothetical protein BZB76_6908, partial [Actinomadura pelletieri DSM 43383]